MVIIGVSMPKKNNASYSQDRVINRCIFLEEEKEVREEQNNRQKTSMIINIVYHCSKKNKDIFISSECLDCDKYLTAEISDDFDYENMR